MTSVEQKINNSSLDALQNTETVTLEPRSYYFPKGDTCVKWQNTLK
jgi:hypothetical protein